MSVYIYTRVKHALNYQKYTTILLTYVSDNNDNGGENQLKFIKKIGILFNPGFKVIPVYHITLVIPCNVEFIQVYNIFCDFICGENSDFWLQK